ncbi:hypothetical protein BG000_005382, partial [Podila horticola]
HDSMLTVLHRYEQNSEVRAAKAQYDQQDIQSKKPVDFHAASRVYVDGKETPLTKAQVDCKRLTKHLLEQHEDSSSAEPGLDCRPTTASPRSEAVQPLPDLGWPISVSTTPSAPVFPSSPASASPSYSACGFICTTTSSPASTSPSSSACGFICTTSSSPASASPSSSAYGFICTTASSPASTSLSSSACGFICTTASSPAPFSPSSSTCSFICKTASSPSASSSPSSSSFSAFAPFTVTSALSPATDTFIQFNAFDAEACKKEHKTQGFDKLKSKQFGIRVWMVQPQQPQVEVSGNGGDLPDGLSFKPFKPYPFVSPATPKRMQRRSAYIPKECQMIKQDVVKSIMGFHQMTTLSAGQLGRNVSHTVLPQHIPTNDAIDIKIQCAAKVGIATTETIWWIVRVANALLHSTIEAAISEAAKKRLAKFRKVDNSASGSSSNSNNVDSPAAIKAISKQGEEQEEEQEQDHGGYPEEEADESGTKGDHG